jgi:23S rRNA (adenine2503-C2)-methyltransferase
MGTEIIRHPIAGLTLDEIVAAFSDHGIDEKYAIRAAHHVYKKKEPAIGAIVNTAGTVRRRIGENFTTGITPPSARIVSDDGSVKYIFSYSGNRRIETVFIPETKRTTVCVSTQCGCARGCAYCLTGDMGFRGNLTSREIVNQILSLPGSAPVTHVVFMGMGEPMDNTDEVLKAVEILTAEWGMALGAANITVSTVGIIPGIEKLLAATRCNLTLSLVSSIASERERLVPTERVYPAASVLDLIRNAPKIKQRRFSVAYMMLSGLNDKDEHLRALISLLKGSSVRVNILKYHPHSNLPFMPSPPERMNHFRRGLLNAGISASIRKSRGEDISAACGMLGE